MLVLVVVVVVVLGWDRPIRSATDGLRPVGLPYFVLPLIVLVPVIPNGSDEDVVLLPVPEMSFI